jgi:hypothetical protein
MYYDKCINQPIIEAMKKYIIISVMLASVLGMNAQTVNRGSRAAQTNTQVRKASDNDDKKSTRPSTEKPARDVNTNKSETHTREAAPSKATPAAKKPEPVYNESRNREVPQVRPTNVTKREEKPTEVNHTGTQSNNSRPESGSQNPPRTRTESNNRANSVNSEGSHNSYERPESRNTNNSIQGNDRGLNDNRQKEAEYRNVRDYQPRTQEEYVDKRRAYRTPERPRTARTVSAPANYVHHPVEYRRTYYPYAEPRRMEIIWDVHMYNEYRYLYPQYDYWYYPFGYLIETISAYDADHFIGEVARVYGRISDVWYEGQTDEYYFYFGEIYPYQDFSIIVPGRTARRFSYHPERYFMNRNVAVTGLISGWEDRPEMQIRKRSQIEVYF